MGLVTTFHHLATANSKLFGFEEKTDTHSKAILILFSQVLLTATFLHKCICLPTGWFLSKETCTISQFTLSCSSIFSLK